jgi:hypothetical protein
VTEQSSDEFPGETCSGTSAWYWRALPLTELLHRDRDGDGFAQLATGPADAGHGIPIEHDFWRFYRLVP